MISGAAAEESAAVMEGSRPCAGRPSSAASTFDCGVIYHVDLPGSLQLPSLLPAVMTAHNNNNMHGS